MCMKIFIFVISRYEKYSKVVLGDNLINKENFECYIVGFFRSKFLGEEKMYFNIL